MDPPLSVACRPDGDAWRCEVRVGDDVHSTTHEVMVTRAELQRYAAGEADPTALVRASFEFLLAREPRESILSRFQLEVIERYFPGFGEQIREAVGRTAAS